MSEEFGPLNGQPFRFKSWRREGPTMPAKAERALRAEAEKKWPGDKKRQDRYVYGGMRHKLGWKPSTQKKGKK